MGDETRKVTKSFANKRGFLSKGQWKRAQKGTALMKRREWKKADESSKSYSAYRKEHLGTYEEYKGDKEFFDLPPSLSYTAQGKEVVHPSGTATKESHKGPDYMSKKTGVGMGSEAVEGSKFIGDIKQLLSVFKKGQGSADVSTQQNKPTGSDIASGSIIGDFGEGKQNKGQTFCEVAKGGGCLKPGDK